MKICLAQIEVIPCRPDTNYTRIKAAVVEAKQGGADLIVFPELCLSGYLIGDTWEEVAFLRDILRYNEDVRDLADGIDIVFGSIGVDFDQKHTDGRPVIYNALYLAKNKEFTEFGGYDYYIKTLLPNYREFEEPRHFSAGGYDHVRFYPHDIGGVHTALTICEDGWDKDYPISPIDVYAHNGAELIINISCSPYTMGKNGSRNRVFGQGHAKEHGHPLLYVNAVGIQNNCKTLYTFDGSSVAYNKNGDIVAQAPMFEECLLYVEYLDGDILPGKMHSVPGSEIAEIDAAMKYGIKCYLAACGTEKVVIGISGGIDSAVAAALYAQVVGPENLLLVNMPSRYNSATTRNIAEQIALNIECYYTVAPIEDSVHLTKNQINSLTLTRILSKELKCRKVKLTDFHMENVQARDRSSRILSALSSAWGGVFTNNGNKAETTVGYATLYGDVCGFLAALGDLWKHQVYALGRHINTYYDVLPEEVFTVVASAELSLNQNVDEGKGDPIVYWYHDRLFATWEERWLRCTPEDNLRWYLDGMINHELHVGDGQDVYKLFPTVERFTEDLERWYKLFKGMGAAKRTQAPPILAVSRRAYGFDYRETLNGFYLTRGYLELKEKALNNI